MNQHKKQHKIRNMKKLFLIFMAIAGIGIGAWYYFFNTESTVETVPTEIVDTVKTPVSDTAKADSTKK
jgi:hypothetical protein